MAWTDKNDIYPLTIVKDRYSGCYSGGEYTAWNLEPEEIPTEIFYDDVSCYGFWLSNKILVGKGDTPQEAIMNLEKLLGDE